MRGFRLFTLFVAAVAACGIIALLPLTLIGSSVLESSYREYAVRDMKANAHLFALALVDGEWLDHPGQLQETLSQAELGSATRFTIVASDGTVVADSDEEADRMENHATRPEVRQAMAGQTGIDIRQSPTLGTDWIYIAIPVGDQCIVRAAASLDDLNARLSVWWNRVLIGLAISLLVLLILAFAVSRILTKPLENATAAAERYAKGNFSYRLPISGSAEMQNLSLSLDTMAAELETRFKIIETQREEMSAIFDNMSEGVLAIDPDGKIMLANGAAETMLGLGPNNTGKNIEKTLRISGLFDAIQETRASDRAQEREIRLNTEQGEEKHLHVQSAKMFEHDQELGILMVFRDVTRLRQLEIIRKDFIANVSHELRTPITTIQSCLESLAEENDSADNYSGQLLAMALRNTRRMGDIINDLLLLAGMESGVAKAGGKVALSRLRPIVDDAISLRSDAAQAKKNRIYHTMRPGCSCAYQSAADQPRFGQFD